jgi:hypothetical protein
VVKNYFLQGENMMRFIATAVVFFLVAVESWGSGLTMTKVDTPAHLSSASSRPVCLAIQTHNAVKVDGDLTEWTKSKPILLDQKGQAIRTWADAKDLSAKVYLMWDSKYLYVGAEVTDDVLASPALLPNGGLWEGDSIELGFDPLLDRAEGKYAPDDYDFAFGLTDKGPAVWRYTAPRTKAKHKIDSLVLAVAKKPDGTGYGYELAIPWKELEPLNPIPYRECGFSVVVNDNDGKGFKGGLQWTPGLWNKENPIAFGRLVLEPVLAEEGSTELFLGSQKSLIREKQAALDLVINSGGPLPQAKMKIAVLDAKNNRVAEITQPIDPDKGIRRYRVAWDIGNAAPGPYRIEGELSTAENPSRGRTDFTLTCLAGLMSDQMAQADRSIQDILKRSIEAQDPHLGIRVLDILMEKNKAERLLAGAAGPEDLREAQALLDRCEEMTRVVQGKGLSAKAKDTGFLKVIGNSRTDAVWEEDPEHPKSGSVCFYYAGVPVASLSTRQYPSVQAVENQLKEWFTYDKKEGFTITEKKIGEYRVYAVYRDGRLRFLDLVKGNTLDVVLAPDEETGLRVAEKVASGSPITAEEVRRMGLRLASNSEVDAWEIHDILKFDFTSAVILPSPAPNGKEKALTAKLKDNLGGKVLTSSDPGGSKWIICVGTPADHPLIKKLNGENSLFSASEDSGVLTCRSAAGRNILVVGGNNSDEVIAAGKTLINLVSVLKDRKVLVGDLHLHTAYSDGSSPPFVVVLAMLRNYMDFAAITDHNTILGMKEAMDKIKSTGVYFPLLPGQEITTSWGHMTGIGCDQVIDPNLPPSEIMARAHKMGGLVFAAHIGWPESTWATETLTDWVRSGVDGFEYRGQTPQFYPTWKKMENLPRIVSGTDSHDTRFGEVIRTIVFAKSDQPKDILAALKEGYCLGLTSEGVFGPDRLIDVFNTLMEEGVYLKTEYDKRLAVRVAALKNLCPAQSGKP